MMFRIFLCRKNKLQMAIKIAIATLVAVNSSLISANSPDRLQIEDDKVLLPNYSSNSNGAFNLDEETSTIVSVATGPVQAHYPGIRTGATVNNLKGELRVCSTVTAHYQILDIDGDWDASMSYDNVKDGDSTYTHLKTSDTIQWFLIDTNTQEKIVLDESYITKGVISPNRLDIKIPETIDFNGELRSTLGMTLGYEITPWTMIGSIPRTIGEIPFVDFQVDSEIKPVVVNDITQSYYLRPNSFDGVDAVSKDVNTLTDVETELNYEGMPEPELTGSSFITVGTIIPASLDDCDLGTKNRFDIQILELDINGNETGHTLDDSLPKVDTLYKAVVKEWNPSTLTYEDKTDKYLPYITWNYYISQENGDVTYLSKYMTSNGFMNVPEGDSDALANFDPNNQSSFIPNSIVESRFSATHSNAVFKTQLTNSVAVPNLDTLEPNFSEQGLKIQIILVLPNKI